jgi:hypothetical protein
MIGYLSRCGFDPSSAATATLAGLILGEFQKLSRGELPPDLTGAPYDGRVAYVRYFMSGTDLIDLDDAGFRIWCPWYTLYCVPLWFFGWWLFSRPLVRRYRRKRLA